MKRMMMLVLAVLMVYSSTVTCSATESQEIGVYAETVKTAVRVTAALENRNASLEMKDGGTVEVTKASTKAATVSVVWIPSAEEAAWAWIESCLEENLEPSAAYEVTLSDADGNVVSNRGMKLSLPGDKDAAVYGISTDGTMTCPSFQFADGRVVFTCDGSEYYVLAREVLDQVVAKTGDVEYATVTEALAAAKSGDTVQLVADAVVEGTVTLPVGVTLDLGAYTLTADYVIGFKGSYLTATPNAGKLIVAKDNIILGQNGYVNNAGQYILPIWDPALNCYQFSLFVVNTANAERGLFIDEEAETIFFRFKHQATGALNKPLLGDGASDNALSVIIRLEWETENGIASQDFYYNDTQIGLVAGTYDYTFTLAGYSAMHIKLETLKVKGMIVTDSGATAFGTEWTQANAK